jgi:hypothetical protein
LSDCGIDEWVIEEFAIEKTGACRGSCDFHPRQLQRTIADLLRARKILFRGDPA